MFQLIIDFSKKLLLISAEVATALNNPLEFNYFLNYKEKIFAVSGEILWFSPDGRMKRRPLKRSQIAQYWDETENAYRISAGEYVLSKIEECIPCFYQSSIYSIPGEISRESNAIFFSLTKAELKC